jgi:hypothetical protein
VSSRPHGYELSPGHDGSDAAGFESMNFPLPNADTLTTMVAAATPDASGENAQGASLEAIQGFVDAYARSFAEFRAHCTQNGLSGQLIGRLGGTRGPGLPVFEPLCSPDVIAALTPTTPAPTLPSPLVYTDPTCVNKSQLQRVGSVDAYLAAPACPEIEHVSHVLYDAGAGSGYEGLVATLTAPPILI